MCVLEIPWQLENILATYCTPSKDRNYLDLRLFGAMIDNVSLITSGLKECFYFWGHFSQWCYATAKCLLPVALALGQVLWLAACLI